MQRGDEISLIRNRICRMRVDRDNPRVTEHDGIIREFYERLFAAYGPQHWWPGDTQVEIVVGAVLTQNTNWKNVEYAIENLKRANVLDWSSLRDISVTALAEHIRPSDYYNIKTKRLKHLVHWIWEQHGGDLSELSRIPIAEARAQLLAVNGIGPETADSILLYALGRPIFVIDAYTRRILRRHGLASDATNYDAMQEMFRQALSTDADLFNEYHALIVRLAKEQCRVKANCAKCPLAFHTHNEHLR